MRCSAALALCLVFGPGQAYGQRVADSGEPTVIYFVRHGEVEFIPPHFPLNTVGKRRAQAFARTVTDVRFTHLFSSHTTRARQMLETIAERQQLPIRQLPEPGSPIDGAIVDDRTPSRVAIPLLVEAIRALPPGSTALVGVNSDNVFAILHGLGVPVASAERACTTGGTCVPCLTNKCFPDRYDHLWILFLGPDGASPKLIELRYGDAEPN
ncbi:MAG TPA: histidine phosphatase family protein [Gemmatimonadaceae bacterium]|nr:histidine phosphatase family protein [Gemmatimonadaceae bacterium]